MSAATISARRPAPLPTGHIHLPSVHVRDRGGCFDYEEDIYVRGPKRGRIAERVIQLTVIKGGVDVLYRETRDLLCHQEQIDLAEALPLLMGEDQFSPLLEVGPEAQEEMEKRGRWEYERQLRIAAGAEKACLACGCSETRACSGGCIWLSSTICSRCAGGLR